MFASANQNAFQTTSVKMMKVALKTQREEKRVKVFVIRDFYAAETLNVYQEIIKQNVNASLAISLMEIIAKESNVMTITNVIWIKNAKIKFAKMSVHLQTNVEQTHIALLKIIKHVSYIMFSII